MSGLLAKEFLGAKAQKKMLAAMVVMAVAFGVLGGISGISRSGGKDALKSEGVAALLGIAVSMIAFIAVVNSVSCDEKAKWNIYAHTLPVRPSQGVGAKYLFLVILSAVGAALGVLILLAVSGARPCGLALLILCAIAFGVPGFLGAFYLPFCFALGMQKASVVLIIVCFSPTMVELLLDRSGVSLPRLSDAQAFTVLKAVPFAALVLLAISFFISCRIYAKKEC